MIEMEYDKNSFLAGVAAGRNMRSWPYIMKGGPVFMYEVDITLNGNHTTEYSSIYAIAGNGDISIDWGDGSAPTRLTNPTAATARHMYRRADGDRFIVTIIGELTFCRFPPDQGTSPRRPNITRVLTPFPKSMSARSDFNSVFTNQWNLISTPENLFQYCHNVETLANAFYWCFAYKIPARLLERQFLLQNMAWCFAGAGQNLDRIDIPEDLFDDCALITDFSRCWYEIDYTSSTAPAMPHPPKYIPGDLFDPCVNVETFDSCFSNSKGVQGNVPELWISHPNADGNSCFMGCERATNYADIPAAWK